MARRPALVRVEGARRRHDRVSLEVLAASTTTPPLGARAGRGALPRRHARALPAARSAPGDREALDRRRRRPRRRLAPRRAASTRRRPRPLRRRASDRRRDVVASTGPASRWPPARRRAPDGRRAVQLVDRPRRRAGAEGVPAPGAGRQPRARDAALPHRARLREHRRRCAAGTSSRASSLDATLGVAQELRADGRDGWELVLDDARDGPGARARRPRASSARSSGGCTPCWAPTSPTRTSRPRSPGEEAPRAADRDDRRGDRARLPRPARRRRGARPDRRPRRGDPRPPAAHVARRRRRQAHPPPRRPAPRPDAAHAGRGWVVLDFEGEPARPLHRAPPQALAAARRRRDAALVRLRGHGGEPPAAARPCPRTGRRRARERFLDGYFTEVDAGLLPAGEAGIRQLLAIFELEKAVYELRYELNNRPDWVPIPVAGIARLLEEPLT